MFSFRIHTLDVYIFGKADFGNPFCSDSLFGFFFFGKQNSLPQIKKAENEQMRTKIALDLNKPKHILLCSVRAQTVHIWIWSINCSVKTRSPRLQADVAT